MRTYAGTVLLSSLVVACRQLPGGGASSLDDAARVAITDTVRAQADGMIAAMRSRRVHDVLAFYGKHAAYVGNGAIGDWDAILAAAPPRYGTYARAECAWSDPLRIDVLSRASAVVTGVLTCDYADTTGRAWHEVLARTEVLAPEDGTWRIVAVHESAPPAP